MYCCSSSLVCVCFIVSVEAGTMTTSQDMQVCIIFCALYAAAVCVVAIKCFNLIQVKSQPLKHPDISTEVYT